MAKSILKDKSYAFSVGIVKQCQKVRKVHGEFVLSKQLLRSGTAIGALVREAEYAESKKDFIHKMSISLKEANETIYWLDLLSDTDYLIEEDYSVAKKQCKELVAMLVSTIKTSKGIVR